MSKDIKIDFNALRGKRKDGYLTGKMLIAMPQVVDKRYRRSVIVLYEHNENGAKGFSVNRKTEKVTFAELTNQLKINCQNPPEPSMYQGGNVDNMRGFVLHSADRPYRTSLTVAEGLLMTSSIDPLSEIANRLGPKQRMVLLGQMVWAAGELERELAENQWLIMDHDIALIFEDQERGKWLNAMRKMGLDPAMLSVTTGES